jgi:uncharacterized protein YggE
MKTTYFWIFVVAAVLSVIVGVTMFVRLLAGGARAIEKPEPPERAVRVTGHGSDKLVAPRLTWTLDVCADTVKLTSERAHEALRRGQKVFAAEDLTLGAVEPDDPQDKTAHACATLELSSTKVAEAFRWHRGLVAAGIVEHESGMDPECSGDEPVAAAKARASMAAIKDARAQADALLDGSAARKNLDADVSVTDEGSWDAHCERIITAEATLTIPTL